MFNESVALPVESASSVSPSEAPSRTLILKGGMGEISLSVNPDLLEPCRFFGPKWLQVRTEDEEIRIRSDDGRWFGWLVDALSGADLSVRIELSPKYAWDIRLTGGVFEIRADLRGLDLRSLVLKGGVHSCSVKLPKPKGTVPVRISGGAHQVDIVRPLSTAARLSVRGGIAELDFDDHSHALIGGRTVLSTPSFSDSARRYEVELTGGVADLSLRED